MLKTPNSQMTQKLIKTIINESIPNHQKRIILQTKQSFIILMIYGV